MGSIRQFARRPGLWLSLAVVVLATGATIIYVATQSPDQAQVSADVLPVVPTARQAATYVDCSKVNAVIYDPHNPCQTFLLLHSSHFRSAAAFLNAEGRQLRAAGWRHTTTPMPIDRDAFGGNATLNESWVAPQHRACAYVATGTAGVTAEARLLLPYDPYDVPHGVLTFYLKGKAANPSQTLWARLQPDC
jgi:hypothetical protein